MNYYQQPTGVDRQVCEIQDASVAAEDQEIGHLVVNDPVNGVAGSPAGQEPRGRFQNGAAKFPLASVIKYSSNKEYSDDGKIFAITLK
ncbi:hypothetical protein D3C87_1955890 [compost metagenome]